MAYNFPICFSDQRQLRDESISFSQGIHQILLVSIGVFGILKGPFYNGVYGRMICCSFFSDMHRNLPSL